MLKMKLLDGQAARLDHSAARIAFWRTQAEAALAQAAALTELCTKLTDERDRAQGNTPEIEHLLRLNQNQRDQLTGAWANRETALKRAREANKRADASEANLRQVNRMLFEALYPGAHYYRTALPSLLAAVSNLRARADALQAHHAAARQLAAHILSDVDLRPDAQEAAVARLLEGPIDG